MAAARKTRPVTPRNGDSRSREEGLRERASELRKEASRLLAAADREGKASAVDSESARLSSQGQWSHPNNRKSSDVESSAIAARRGQLRSGDAMGRHEIFDTESSVVVGQICSMSADKPKKADKTVRGAKIAPLNLDAMSIGELAALLSVYEQAGRAFSRNMFWPELGVHGGCRTDDEAERCASIQSALLGELAKRSATPTPDRALSEAPAEASRNKGLQ